MLHCFQELESDLVLIIHIQESRIMATCTSCGSDVTGKKFCPECGTPVQLTAVPTASGSAAPATTFCSNCGKQSTPGEHFCSNCGTSLHAPSAASMTPASFIQSGQHPQVPQPQQPYQTQSQYEQPNYTAPPSQYSQQPYSQPQPQYPQQQYGQPQYPQQQYPQPYGQPQYPQQGQMMGQQPMVLRCPEWERPTAPAVIPALLESFPRQPICLHRANNREVSVALCREAAGSMLWAHSVVLLRFSAVKCSFMVSKATLRSVSKG